MNYNPKNPNPADVPKEIFLKVNHENPNWWRYDSQFRKDLIRSRVFAEEAPVLDRMLPDPPKRKVVWDRFCQKLLNEIVLERGEKWDEVAEFFKELAPSQITKTTTPIPSPAGLARRFYVNFFVEGRGVVTTRLPRNKHWSGADDKAIHDAIIKYGAYTGKWALICQAVPGRSPLDIWKRYIMYAWPYRDTTSSWTHGEDELLLQGIARFGVDYESVRVMYLPDRSTFSIARRWIKVKWPFYMLAKFGLLRFWTYGSYHKRLPRHQVGFRGIRNYDVEEDYENLSRKGQEKLNWEVGIRTTYVPTEAEEEEDWNKMNQEYNQALHEEEWESEKEKGNKKKGDKEECRFGGC
ncbi:hypothetical protein SAICODRAFT_30439 [Saitoella complicata NRRL Y-17804]|nr:uncharacterized protein SAICODRAFT_30439 [Saitoella complicata NRRL Y-17804]ODQ53038.1 hypothetical protein SAICODRAFT_30439 [Saitoella complicata NRRL Y-17804]